MADKKITTASKLTANKIPEDNSPLFYKKNYQLMAVGAVIIAAGMLVMSGGKSNNPNVFLDAEVYSSIRITIAPILIIAGLLVEVYAIFKKEKPSL